MPPLAVGIVLFSTILHAGWNLVAKQRSDSWTTIRQILVTISVPAVVLAAWAELFTAGILHVVWPFLLGASCAQAVYFLGLTLGYRAGDLGVVYPVTRALPVLFLGGFDLARSLSPSAMGWLGLALVAAGCIVISLAGSPRRAGEVGVRRPRVLHATIGWAAVAAAGTVGYTVFDKLAAEALRRESGGGLIDAVQYGLWEFVITTILYAPLLVVAMRVSARRRAAAPVSRAPVSWRSLRTLFGDWRIAAVGFSMFAAYSLVLWAYQLSERASYVVALRQFSIVLGVVAAAVLMRERAPFVRIGAAVVIVAGIALVAMAP